MKLTNTLMLLTLLFAVINCTKTDENYSITESNNVKTYSNKNVPSVEVIDFNPRKMFSINDDPNSADYISYFDLDLISSDSEGNIYIGDMGNSPKVNKYNKDGELITSFVKLGTGPGEVGRISFVCVSEDTVYVGDWNRGIVSLFNKSGEFIKQINPKSSLFQVKPLGTDKLTALMFNNETVEKKIMLRMKIAILDRSLNIEKILYSHISDPELLPEPDQWTYMANTDSCIYLGVDDKKNYIVNIYDKSGEVKEVVRKSYSVIEFEQSEIDKIEKYVKATMNNRLNRNTLKNKRAVVGVYIDKRGHLIVQPSVDINKDGSTSGIPLDFYKDNIFLKSVILETENPYCYSDFSVFLKFMDNKLYLIDSMRNLVEVYEY
ncbi:MAG: hypothetical protein JXR48_15665 [Candidatus Delongbacteria bacterium]|nr:hypothetical protein [Candidatus Delongbacteria bacterium]MBN2836394.1 hypothetical protein [Candidatus Delongbacteria bacterium]